MNDKIKTGVAAIDKVLDGGAVPGSVVLLCGAPGVGKTRLLKNIKRSVAYVVDEDVPPNADRILGAGDVARAANRAVFVVGMITKQGKVLGGSAAEHAADAVLILKVDSLTATKNRFGRSGISARIVGARNDR